MKNVRIKSAALFGALGIFLVLSVGIGSVTFVHAAAEDRAEYVCAEFVEPKEGEAGADTKGTKEVAGGAKEAQEQIKLLQKNKETKDVVEIKDGKITIESTCGKEGTTGTVKFCITSAKCVTVDKDGSEQGAVRDFAQQELNRLNEQKIKLAAQAIKSGAELPPEFQPFLQGLGRGQGPLGGNVSAERVAKELRKEPIDKIEGILQGIVNQDPVAANAELAREGFLVRVTQKDLASLSKGVEKLVPSSQLARISAQTDATCSLGSGFGVHCRGGNVLTVDSTFGGSGAAASTPRTNSANTQRLSGIDAAREAIASIESSGNYRAIGPPTRYGRAIGRYQMLPQNAAKWSCETPGVPCMSATQMLNNSRAQDAVAEYKLTQFRNKCGSWGGAAVMWFSGRCGVSNRDDGYTSVAQYLSKFNAAFGKPASSFTAAGGSPFARTGPFSHGSDVSGSFGSTGFGGGGLGNIGGLVKKFRDFVGGNLGGGSSRNVSDNGSASSPAQPPKREQPEAPIEKPALNFRAHPSEVAKGDSIQFIWTTTGVSESKKCALVDEDRDPRTAIAEGNSGEHVYEVPAITDPDVAELEFTLQCVARDRRVSPDDARMTIRIRIIN